MKCTILLFYGGNKRLNEKYECVKTEVKTKNLILNKPVDFKLILNWSITNIGSVYKYLD